MSNPSMEERVQTQAREIQRYRSDYLELSQKFNQINSQIKERDMVHLDRLKTAENHIQHIESENAQYKSQLAVFKSDRKAQHKKDKEVRKELDAAISVMEEREGQIESQLTANNSKMRRMEAELLTLKEQLEIYQEKNESLLESKNNLGRIIKEDMVPAADYQNSVSKFEKFQEVVSSETVSLEEYEIVCKKLSNAKKVMDNNCVSLDEYDELSLKYCRLEARVQEMVTMDEFHAIETKADSAWKQIDKMIPKATYIQLQMEANAVLERQMLLEASSQVLRDARDEAVRQRTEMRLETDGMQTRLNLVEKDLKEMTAQVDEAKDTIVEKTLTIQQLEQELADKESHFISSQEKVASLSVALGNNKQLLHREMSSRSELLSSLQLSQQEMEKMEKTTQSCAESHQGDLAMLRKVHQKQILQYETKCAELISAVDVLKYHMGPAGGGGNSNRLLSNGVGGAGGGDENKQNNTNMLTMSVGSPTASASSITSPYKELLSQYLKKQSSSAPAPTHSNSSGYQTGSHVRTHSNAHTTTPTSTSTSAYGYTHNPYAESKSPDIYPAGSMRLNELKTGSGPGSPAYSRGGASPSPSRHGNRSWSRGPSSPATGLSSPSGTATSTSKLLRNNNNNTTSNSGGLNRGGGGGGESTLASLCASFKSHMSESSKLFTDEINQVDF